MHMFSRWFAVQSRRWGLAIASVGALAGNLQAQSLPAPVEAALARAKVPPEALAVWVANADSDAPRLAYRAQAAVNPASVMKLVTTYAALELLGPAYTWQTPVFVAGPLQQGGRLRGDVYLQGQGDPKLVVERLWLLLSRLQAQGVRQIDGDIVLDRTAFALPPDDPARFDGEPLRPYNAGPDALLLNYKTLVLRLVPDPEAGLAHVQYEPPLAGLQLPATVALAAPGAACGDWRAGLELDFTHPQRLVFQGVYPTSCGEKTWTIAPPDPQGFAARAVEGLWRQMGGRLGGVVRDGRVPPERSPTFHFASPPLAEVVRDVNKFSNNVMAQQLFLSLALSPQTPATPEAAREALLRWWRTRLPEAEPPVVDNGAGLSRDARISAHALGRMLQAAWRSPVMPELLASLPLAGVDGTLRRSALRPGSAHLKTGSLRDVAALAGYVHAANGQRKVLVAIVNHPNAAAARPALDALVDWAVRTP